jgi:ABC-type transport system involved in cytochrome bd biosynthesis fused ATPase/permease subunit
VVTQRISTIRNADKIIVLDTGKIIEEGNHESLLSKKGAYYRIYQTLYEAQKEVVKTEKVVKNSKAQENLSKNDKEQS